MTLKLWQKVGIGVAGLFGAAWVVSRATTGAGSPAATPHGGTVGPSGSATTPQNSGTSAKSLATTLGLGALTGAGLLLGQKATGAVMSRFGSASTDTTADPTGATDTSAATAEGGVPPEAANAETDTNLTGEATATEATAAETTAADTGLLGELEALGGEAATAIEAAPELELLAVL